MYNSGLKCVFYSIIFFLITFPGFSQSSGNKQDTIFLMNGRKIIGSLSSVTGVDVEIITGKGFQTLTRFIPRDKIDHIGITSEARFRDLLNNKTPAGISPGYMMEAAGTRSAGSELQKFTRHYYTGIALEIFGSGLSYAGLISFDSHDDEVKNQAKAVLVLGGLTSLIGIIYTLESFSHIGTAGRLLDQDSKVSLMTPSSIQGIGIRYSFDNKHKKSSSLPPVSLFK